MLLVLLVLCGPAAPAWAADWRWPLDGAPAVSRPFKAPAHRYAAGHRGADLAGSPGAPVRAAGDGLVSYAGLVAGRGVVVVVHGDLRTTYEPVRALVGVGDLVAAGEVVGVLEPGHVGCPVLACLHWGLRRGEDYLDPVRLVAPGPVRLLPVGGAVGGAGPTGAAPAAGVGEVGGGAVVRGGRVLAPASARAPAPAVSQGPTDVDVGAAATAALLGAAAVGAARRRRA